MKIFLGFLAVISLSLLTFSCSDATQAQWDAVGNPGHIKCYSGTQIIYEGDSTGKISTEQGSDGWYFMDAKTQGLVRVSGACVITD